MRELEAGFSVSESSEDGGADMHSSGAPSSRQGGGGNSPDNFNSHYTNNNNKMMPRPMMQMDSMMMMAGVGGGENMEARIRMEQQRAAMQSEVASAKHRYLKRVNQLERDLEKARSEKREL